MIEGILLQLVAEVDGVAVLQVERFFALTKGNAGDGGGAVGEVEPQVFAHTSYASRIAVVDHVAGSEHGSRVAGTKGLQVAQQVEELRRDILEIDLSLYIDGGSHLFGADMGRHVLLKAATELSK